MFLPLELIFLQFLLQQFFLGPFLLRQLVELQQQPVQEFLLFLT